MRKLLLSLGATALFALPASAAQIVVMDIEAKGSVSKKLAEALGPVLVAELSQVEGMSVVSQDDVRALLQLEAEKQMMGCNDKSCMTEIADSLGAELMATSTLSRVGKDLVVSVTLMDVVKAKPVARATGKARGGDEAGSEAIENAVHNTFKQKLPRMVNSSPASLSRRGFRAALAGLHQVAMKPGKDPAGSRRRVILDLINTELDYDANPKISMLEQQIRRGQYDVKMAALGSRNKREFAHYMDARAFYTALWHDMGRVKEIRERARAEGRAPTSTALRFETPDPVDMPDSGEVRRYVKGSGKQRKIVSEAIAALKKNQPKRFAKLWKDERRALSSFESLRKQMSRYKNSWELVPMHAHLPDQIESALRTQKDKEGKATVVYLRQFKKGKLNTSDTVRLEKVDNRWRITSW